MDNKEHDVAKERQKAGLLLKVGYAEAELEKKLIEKLNEMEKQIKELSPPSKKPQLNEVEAANPLLMMARGYDALNTASKTPTVTGTFYDDSNDDSEVNELRRRLAETAAILQELE